jgi:hypothetical protein
MKKVRLFIASVSVNHNGTIKEHQWPVYVGTHGMATEMAFAYVLRVLKIQGDSELRVVGS